MAPELFKGEGKSKHSDIYALGVLFYYLSSQGQFPIQAESLDQLKEKVISKPSIQLKHLSGPNKWKQLIKSMLSYSTAKRPTADEVKILINEIKLAPMKRTKRVSIYSLILLLLTVSLTSLFSYFQEKNSNEVITSALNETTEVNNMMFELLTAVNPATKGKDVLMVDVIDDLIIDIKANENISNDVKAQALYTSAHSLDGLGFTDQALELLKYIGQLPNISNYFKAMILIAEVNFNRPMRMSEQSLQAAKALLDQALLIYPQIANNNSDISAEYYIEKSLIDESKHELVSAKAHANIALKILKTSKKRKYTHQKMGRIYNQLGHIAQSENDYLSAINYLKKAIEAINLSNPNLNQNNIATRGNLANALRENGNLKESIDIYNALTEDAASFLGKETPEYISIIMGLASAHTLSKNYEKAFQINQEILPLVMKKYGEESLAYLVIKNTVANIYMAQLEFSVAQENYLEIITIAEKKLGTNNEFTLLFQSNLAELYYQSDRPKMAIIYAKEKLPIAREHLGDENIYTIFLNETLGWSYHLINENHLALPIMQDVLKRRLKIYKPDHESVLLAQKRLTTISNALALNNL